MRIVALEPYDAISHQLFLSGLREHSRHSIEILTLPARAWKWRMRTAALHFAAQLSTRPCPDLLLVSDYLNLAEMLPLLPATHVHCPSVVYFHENQLSYPLQDDELRDVHFGLTHLYSILVSRRALFNSRFHREEFLEALDTLLDMVPDVDLATWRARVRERCDVLPLGSDVAAASPRRLEGDTPTIVWNHRWEYDKDPDAFVDALLALRGEGEQFAVRVLGQSFRKRPEAFARLERELPDHLESLGTIDSRAEYLRALERGHILVSTARHEFFGLGSLEALRLGLLTVLPDDLAYPELLSEGEPPAAPYLYPRSAGGVPALRLARRMLRDDSELETRDALIRQSERFAWRALAPRYDWVFEEIVENGGQTRAAPL